MYQLFKFDEIEQHWLNYLEEADPKEVESKDTFKLCVEAFDYSPMFSYEKDCIEWLDDHVFEVLEYIKRHEIEVFGALYTDLANPYDVVLSYTFIVGRQIVEKWGKERKTLQTSIYLRLRSVDKELRLSEEN